LVTWLALLFGSVRAVPTPSAADAPIAGLSHVQLLVSNVRASAAWYVLALGLEGYVEDLDIGYVALRHRGSRIVVVLTAGPDVARPDVAGGEKDGYRETTDVPATASGTLDHLAFAVPDEDALRSWADHLTDIGIDHQGVVLENGNPSLQLRDPDGTAIELVAPGTRLTGAHPLPTPKQPG
jgi:catechol 2,3-dioxygenase-like lactoylglutathione lyase family enzyme